MMTNNLYEFIFVLSGVMSVTGLVVCWEQFFYKNLKSVKFSRDNECTRPRLLEKPVSKYLFEDSYDID